MIWTIALVLFVVWLAGVIFGKGGFLHILLLCAVAIVVVQLVGRYRAAQ